MVGFIFILILSVCLEWIQAVTTAIQASLFRQVLFRLVYSGQFCSGMSVQLSLFQESLFRQVLFRHICLDKSCSAMSIQASLFQACLFRQVSFRHDYSDMSCLGKSIQASLVEASLGPLSAPKFTCIQPAQLSASALVSPVQCSALN